MHIPVLLHECIEGLNLKPGMTVIDATINGGGHSEALARRYGKDIHIVGIDLDIDALIRSEKRLTAAGAHFTLVQNSFKNISTIVQDGGFTHIGGVLFDFGLSSDQFDSSGRGFSFQKDEPLLMTFKKTPTSEDVTARDIVNDWEESSIETILKGFGEEQYARRIAQAIVAHREVKPIERTSDLVAIIEEAVPAAYKRRRINPSTKTFQALRIATNGELTAISEGLEGALKVIAPGGRVCAISFHSLEDRIVKRFFKEQQGGGQVLITKKPIIPSDQEIDENPRSRSAKLRIIEKTS